MVSPVSWIRFLRDAFLSFRWLRTEAQLLQLDAQIKSNLGLDRANTDKCLQAMDDILALSIDPLMLKKHPHIVETVKRVSDLERAFFNYYHVLLIFREKSVVDRFRFPFPSCDDTSAIWENGN